MILTFKKIDSIDDAEILRKIRNECREFMTEHNEYINEEQQKKWFKTANQKFDMYLAYLVEHGVIVVEAGYGLIHRNKNESLLTGGLLKDCRDKGLGFDLFKFLISECRKEVPIRLDVLKTNVRALNLYKKLGFMIYQEDDNIFKMELKNDTFV